MHRSLVVLSALVTAAAHGQAALRGISTGQPAAATQLSGLLPPSTLTHFCIITSWDAYNATLATYSALLGHPAPVPGIAGGLASNGTYRGAPLIGTTLIAFMSLNNMTNMEFLAGNPDLPSWWRDVYVEKGFEVHHMGYMMPAGTSIWPVIQSIEAAGLGEPVQWGRWGTIDQNGAGCYVYVDTQTTLGVTIEILAQTTDCDDLPAPPSA